MRLWSPARLRNGIDDWKQITPEPVHKAVAALRREFATNAWKAGEIMRQGCHPALHSGMAEQARTINESLKKLGFPALPNVDGGETEPSVFVAYFEQSVGLLAHEIKRTFSELLAISFAQSPLIGRDTVEWATLEAKLMIADESHGIALWTRDTCDVRPDDPNDLEESIYWTKWRAPRWFFMQPFATRPYDRATAWERMNEDESKRLLEVVEDRFNHRLIMALEKAVGETHIRLAKQAKDTGAGSANTQAEEETLRALVADALRDTALWLQCDPPAEERVCVLAMQEQLADLDRAITGSIERRSSPEDERRRSEIMADLSALLQKARQVRGNIVGKGLARLAERLPQQSSGCEPEQIVLPPIKPFNPSGRVNLNSTPAPSSASGGLKALDYPKDFPPNARDRIEGEKIRASRELLPSAVYSFEDQDLGVGCIMRIFLAFAKEACALGWTLDRVQREADEFLRSLTITVVFAKFPDLHRYWISNWNGSILSDVERRFKASPEWNQYEELLLASRPDLAHNSREITQRPESGLTNRSRNRVGRPRKDDERDLVRKLKASGESWKEIANKVNAQTHQTKTPEAYRALLRSRSVSAKLPGKNGQN